MPAPDAPAQPTIADYRAIVAYYETCLAQHGDSHAGVGWDEPADRTLARYQVMLDLIRPHNTPVSLLDFGCGVAGLYDYIQQQNLPGIEYAGLDLSSRFIDLCSKKHPRLTWYTLDLLADPNALPPNDYLVMNGLFTVKLDIPFHAMFDYLTRLLTAAFARTRQGLAFNLLPTYVDWQRDRMFHVPLDLLADFLAKNLSRHFTIRNDYGLYEYTVYLYHQPSQGQ